MGELEELATSLIEREGRGETPFGFYIIRSNDPAAELGRAVEREVFLEFFGNTPDMLHDQITVDDPVVLEKPFTYTLAYRRMPNYKMVEFVCENNREYLDEKGAVKMKLRER